jgi:hypothetical protein
VHRPQHGAPPVGPSCRRRSRIVPRAVDRPDWTIAARPLQRLSRLFHSAKPERRAYGGQPGDPPSPRPCCRVAFPATSCSLSFPACGEGAAV